MKLEYKLTDSDFLQYQLFVYSKSKRAKRNRMRARMIIPILYIGLALYFMLRGTPDFTVAVLFCLIGITWFVFYPVYSIWRNKKHFRNYVKDHYQSKIGKQIELKFDRGFINSRDYVGEGKIKNSELKELIELKEHFFLKLATGDSLVIPKRAISDLNKFKQMISDLDIPHVDQLNWKWS